MKILHQFNYCCKLKIFFGVGLLINTWKFLGSKKVEKRL